MVYFLKLTTANIFTIECQMERSGLKPNKSLNTSDPFHVTTAYYFYSYDFTITNIYTRIPCFSDCANV